MRALARLAAAVIAFTLAACSDGDGTTAPTTAAAPVEGRVVLVGDSLTVGAEANLLELASRHGFTLELSAANGRQVPAGVEELLRLGGSQAELVVIALGTNDAAQAGFDRSVADARIRQALAAAGAAPVLWVNVYRDPGTPAGEAAEVFNEALRDAEAADPRLEVLDWASFVMANPEVMADDRVHHTWEGYEERSRWLGDHIVGRLASG